MSAPMQAAQAKGAKEEIPQTTIEIDRTDFIDRNRYVCPGAEHSSWDRTNNHIWCPKCVNLAESGHNVDPEYYQIYDKRENRLIPWSNIKIID